MPVEVGQIIEGKVSGITKFGAFVQLPEGKTGLVHISEVAEDYVKDIKTILKENEEVKVKVLSIDGNGKIGLSIKKVNSPEVKENRPRKPMVTERNRQNYSELSFEERLSKFMKDSDEKMHDLKKSFEAKRGGGGYK